MAFMRLTSFPTYYKVQRVVVRSESLSSYGFDCDTLGLGARVSMHGWSSDRTNSTTVSKRERDLSDLAVKEDC